MEEVKPMKIISSVLQASLILAISAAAHAAHSAEGHHHHSHGGEPQKLQLNAGKKWATDAPLRQTMSEINQAMATALPRVHRYDFGKAEYQVLARTIRENVSYAVAHCQLEPKADAMLHLMIADLLAGAAAMEGENADARHDGAVKALQALRSYGNYFQHPGWRLAKG